MKKRAALGTAFIILILLISALGFMGCSGSGFKITFMVDGAVYSSVKINHDETIGLPAEPTKEGYVFDGWYLDDDRWLEKLTVDSIKDGTVGSDTTVYCKWVSAKHTHEYGDWQTNGKRSHSRWCDCGRSETQDHIWSIERVSKEPGCVTKGEKTYECAVCGETKTEPIAANGHDFTDKRVLEAYVVSFATCTKKAVYYYACKNCNEHSDETYEHGEPNGHSFTKKITEAEYLKSAATCTRSAQYYYACVACDERGDTVYDEGEPLGHKFTEAVTGPNHLRTEATCTQRATYYYSCSVCLENDVRIFEDGEPLGHKYDSRNTADIHLKSEATCSQPAEYYFSCDRCGANDDKSFVHGDILDHTYVNGMCRFCGIGIRPAMIARVTGGAINGTNIKLNVSASTNSCPLSDKVIVPTGDTWKLYSDVQGTNEIATKIASNSDGKLVNGDNDFYIIVTAADGVTTNTYKLTIYKSFKISINYYDGSTLLKTENAYTARHFTPEYAPEITGYIFNGWKTADDVAYTGSVLWDNISLHIDKTAARFAAELDVNGGDRLNETLLWMTYDSTYKLAAPTRTGYTFAGWYNGNTQYTDGSGDSMSVWKDAAEMTTLTAKWTINKYKVTLVNNIPAAGEITGGGEYNYGTLVTVNATVAICYGWRGWFAGANDVLVSPQAKYSFTLDAEDVTLVARYQLDSVMEPFTFTNDNATSTVKITGVKDKTVTSLVVPDYVTEITQGALSGCSELAEITLPFIGNKVKQATDGYQYPLGYIFGTEAFGNADNTIQYYYRAPGDPVYTVYYIPNKLKKVTVTGGRLLYGSFMQCNYVEEIILGDKVTGIEESAMQNCSALKKLVIGTGVTSIGKCAAFNCNDLETLIMSASVSSIGEQAFFHCGGLKTVNIGVGVQSIGKEAFRGCTGITELNLNSGLRTIGESAFNGCTGLTILSIPYGVTSVGIESFRDCTSLKRVTVCNSGLPSAPDPAVTDIEERAFRNCNQLTDVIIGDGVVCVGIDAFMGCTRMVNLIIYQNTLTTLSVRTGAFTSCTLVKRVYYKGVRARWSIIMFETNCGPFNEETDITYFYSELTPPIVPGTNKYDDKYWHFDEDGVTPVIWVRP